jgi:REP element-mobilizing transposase RayT
MTRTPKHPPRIVPFQKYSAPLFFITFGTFDRKPILANDAVHGRFAAFGAKQSAKGIAIGRYVILPDHIHYFMRLGLDMKMGMTIGFLKKTLSAALRENGYDLPHWQPGFFDHLIRNADSYSEKWNYVYQNPVRAGLVQFADNWPYSGEIVSIRY